MSREVRRVPADWKHPKDGDSFRPLFGRSFPEALAEWDEGNRKWKQGLRDDWNGGWKPLEDDERGMPYTEWAGSRPIKEDYMPDWCVSDKRLPTHYQMYETTSEGSPISPVFATPEELAHWLADNGASAFGDQTASYEAWLRVCRGGYAPSAVLDDRGLRSGVAALGD